MAVGTWRMDYPMAMVMQQTEITSMDIGTLHLGDNLDTETMCSYRQKTSKTQRMGIRPMVVDAQRTNSGPEAKANPLHEGSVAKRQKSEKF